MNNINDLSSEQDLVIDMSDESEQDEEIIDPDFIIYQHNMREDQDEIIRYSFDKNITPLWYSGLN